MNSKGGTGRQRIEKSFVVLTSSRQSGLVYSSRRTSLAKFTVLQRERFSSPRRTFRLVQDRFAVSFDFGNNNDNYSQVSRTPQDPPVPSLFFQVPRT